MTGVQTCALPISDPGYVAAMADLVRRGFEAARASLDPAVPLRILFSAHGLPEIIVTKGDPYQYQIEQTVAGVIAKLAIPGIDAAICYQSRVTPQKWLGPATEQELERAAHDNVAVLVVPIAFVSDHSETLVELDVEYREFAHNKGVPGYFRTEAANSDSAFIEALAALVQHAIAAGPGLCRAPNGQPCPATHKDCPHRRATAA